MITEYSRTYLTGIFRDHEIPLLRYAQNAHGRGACGQWDFWDARCRRGYGWAGIGAHGGLSEATALRPGRGWGGGGGSARLGAGPGWSGGGLPAGYDDASMRPGSGEAHWRPVRVP